MTRELTDPEAWGHFVPIQEALFTDNVFRRDLVDALAARFPMERLIYELPGWWLGPAGGQKIPTVNALLTQLGPETNLGNVEPSDVLYLETARCKTGVSGFE